MSVDLRDIQTVEEADEVLEDVVDTWSNDDYWELREHREQLAALEPPSRRPHPRQLPDRCV
jgi:hypothetical protein